MVNFNGDDHPMHLHGHSFQVFTPPPGYDGNSRESIGEDAWVPGPVRDTVMVPGGDCSTVRICFDADQANGGEFLLHCHLAIHLAAGMATSVIYEPPTPKPTAQPTPTARPPTTRA